MAEEIVLTESSYRKLQEDLEQLKTVKRPALAEALRKARSYGDLSENFEYHAAKREQGLLNGKIADMERTLELARVVADNADTGGKAGLGYTVVVQDLDEDEEIEYVLVDPIQADPVHDRISIQSPVGQALDGKEIGDMVEVRIPAGVARYEIKAIRRD